MFGILADSFMTATRFDGPGRPDLAGRDVIRRGDQLAACQGRSPATNGSMNADRRPFADQSTGK